MALTPHIEASVYVLRTEEGGRKSPFFCGYRPNHDFGVLGGMLNDAQHKIVGRDRIELGDSGLVQLTLVRPDLLGRRLYPNMEFTVQEGSRIVGRGRITRVLDSALARST